MREVAVEYAVRNGASIAFEVFGAGAVDVVVSNNVFPIDLMWDLPQQPVGTQNAGGPLTQRSHEE